MKRTNIIIYLLITMLFLRADLTTADDASTQPSASATSQPATDVGTYVQAAPDSGADVVALFYKAIVQEPEPTLSQDDILFYHASNWRRVLADRGKLTAKQPLLCWFRDHKDLFLPKHMRSLSDVTITTTFSFNRNVNNRKEVPNSSGGLVLVFYPLDLAYAHTNEIQFRSQVFQLVDGKIDPEDIWLDGFHGRINLSLNEFLDGH